VYFSDTVGEYKELCGAKVYHWAWMGNHYHMLVEVVYENLRGFVVGVQQAYAQYHHARYNGTGVFWQGRFKSRPVEIGSYLTRCGRYIERNPVRAGLTAIAWEYRWSSAVAYVKRVAPHSITCGIPHLRRIPLYVYCSVSDVVAPVASAFAKASADVTRTSTGERFVWYSRRPWLERM